MAETPKEEASKNAPAKEIPQNETSKEISLKTDTTVNTAPDVSVSDQEQQKIETAVIKMLKTNPTKFVEAMNEGMQKQQTAARQELEKGIKQNLDAIKKVSLRLGADDKNGIIAFIDPMCPYCQKWVEEALKVEGVTFHLIPVPLLANDTSNMVGKMMILAYQQDPEKFRKFLKNYHNDPAKINKDSLMKHLKDAGLDTKKIETDLENKDLYKENTRIMEEMKVQSVPSIFAVSGDRVASMPPMDAATMPKAFKDFVDGKLEKA